MADIYINSAVGGLIPATGSKRLPFNTWAAAAAVLTAGDTVYIRGTLAEQITLALPNITLSPWSKFEQFTIDGGSARAFCVRLNTGANNFRCLNGRFIGATQDGFSHTQQADGAALFGCTAENNGFNGFASQVTTAVGKTSLFGCLSQNNTNDGFSVKGFAEWTLYDCVSLGHNVGLSTDGFTTHDDAVMRCFRCVAGGNTKAFSFTHNSKRAVVANCFGFNNEIGLIHVPVSTTLAVGSAHPETVAFGNVFHLNGTSRNSVSHGVASASGALVYAILNTVYNKGAAANPVRGLNLADVGNAGGLPTRLFAVGNVVELSSSSAQAIAVNIGGVPSDFIGYNVYRNDQAGSHFSVLGAAVTSATYLASVSGVDATSIFHNGTTVRGEPLSEATLPLARVASTVPLIPNLATFLEEFPDAKAAVESLLWIGSLEAAPFFALHEDIGIRRYAPCSDLQWSGVSGGKWDLTEAFWSPGAFVGSALSSTTLAHLSPTIHGGVFLVAGHDINTAVLDQRVNKTSIAGDVSRQIVIEGGSIIAAGTAQKVVLWAGKKDNGQPMAVASTTGSYLAAGRILPPGEDLYLEIGDPGTAAIATGEIRYSIRGAVNGPAKSASSRTIPA